MAMSAWGKVSRISLAALILALFRKLLSRLRRRAIKDVSGSVRLPAPISGETRSQPNSNSDRHVSAVEVGTPLEQLSTQTRPVKKRKQKRTDVRSSTKREMPSSQPCNDLRRSEQQELLESSSSNAAKSDAPFSAFNIGIDTPRKNGRTGHTEFPLVIAQVGGTTLHTQWRRYSDFVDFHRASRPSSAKLPGKKFFGSTDHSFVEQRRHGLEQYMQQIFSLDPRCARPELQRFLSWRPLPAPAACHTQQDSASRAQATEHQVELEQRGGHEVPLDDEEDDDEEEEEEDEAHDADNSTRSTKSTETGNEEHEDDEDEAFEAYFSIDGVARLAVDNFVAALKPAYDQIDEMLQDGVMEMISEGPPSLYLKMGTAAGIICSKTVGVIPAPMDAILHLLADPTRRSEYDNAFQCESTVEQFDTEAVSALLGRDAIVCSIRHAKFQSPMPALMSARDTVMATCRTRNADGSIMIAATSVNHPGAPESSSHTRARAIAVGLILKPLSEHRTFFTKVAHLDMIGKVPTNWMLRRLLPKRGITEFQLLSNACCDKSKWPSDLVPVSCV